MDGLYCQWFTVKYWIITKISIYNIWRFFLYNNGWGIFIEMGKDGWEILGVCVPNSHIWVICFYKQNYRQNKR